MDSYMESESAKHEFFLDLMLDYKTKAIEKIDYISNDVSVNEKFAIMLIGAESEDVDYANFFINYFGLDELDKLAIIGDLESFTQEYIKEIEEEYCSSNYEV